MAEKIVPEQDRIREQLAKILSTPVFQRSGILAAILEFVVDETLADRQHTIKAYTIATRVLNRSEDFDPAIDPVVRVHAGRLRRRLRDYYATEGVDDIIYIELPIGTYVPVFSVSDPGSDAAEQALDVPSPSPPSIAVLPFVAIGGSEDAELIAEGVTEELTMALVRYQGLGVIARQSTLRYRGAMPTIEQVGKDLGARFVVTGSVRKAGDTVRVAAQLNDTQDSSHLWADSYQRDLSMTGVFEIQDEIAHRVVALLSDEYGVITRQLGHETRGKRPEELTVYEATLRFYQYNQMPDNESNLRAREALEKALEKEPDYALGWALLGEANVDCHTLGFEGRDDALEYGHTCIHKALNLDPSCQTTQTTAAYVHFVLGEHQTAVEAARRAVELNPHSAFQVATAAFWMGLAGELERACELLERVDPMVPNKPGWLRLVPLLNNLDHEDFENAFAEASRFCTPQLAWDSMLRASAAGLGGNASMAGVALKQFNELFPEVAADPEPYIRGFVHFDHHVTMLLDGLEKAAALAAE